jgi:hypothetical protein
MLIKISQDSALTSNVSGAEGICSGMKNSYPFEPLIHGFRSLVTALMLDLEPVAMPGFATTPRGTVWFYFCSSRYKFYDYEQIQNMKIF